MTEELIDFNIEKVTPSIIMVAGVGGAGGNAVNHMYDLGIQDVSFMVCNTDRQALDKSLVPIKVQLGEGLGAGNKPERGRAAAIESLDQICEIFKSEGTKMVFVTAGMGGGTGTGAAPVIAKAARDAGILTVGIVTMPYASEGPSRVNNALAGIEELKKSVDSLLIINNENIQEIYGELPITEAFGRANDILATAARGIAEIITRPGIVNVDFADVTTVMKDSGIALMGSGKASGEDRALRVAELALSSPLLNHNSVDGATSILFNITYGDNEITLAESTRILDHIQGQAGKKANIIWGAGKNDLLGEDIELTVIATGFRLSEKGNPLDPVQPASGGGRKKWSPPSDPFKHPGKVRSELDEKMQGFSGNGSQVIVVEENRRYKDIEKIANTPAYVRRKVKFVDDSRGSKVRIKEELQKAEEDTRTTSLFGD
ncbi:MAG: cell division protein FtsZ [Rikenellaceae bacterium]|nr:cell division protein FtsZ [Rikenellaceae bacterium]